jgi:hypothetical protein
LEQEGQKGNLFDEEDVEVKGSQGDAGAEASSSESMEEIYVARLKDSCYDTAELTVGRSCKYIIYSC